MMKTSIKTIPTQARVLPSLILLMTLGPGSAAPFTNGGFEGPVVPANSEFRIYAGDSTTMPGWTVGGSTDGVDLCNVLPCGWCVQPLAGAQWLCFNRGAAPTGNTISQTFTTTPGFTYLVSFNVGKVGLSTAPGVAEITATASANDGTLLGSSAGSQSIAPAWGATNTFAFTATTPSTVLTFTDTSSTTTNLDAALDNISVQGIDPLTNGLVAYYPLKGDANDHFGSGNPGILENGAFYTNGMYGEPGSAIYCDGVSGYALMGKNDAVFPNQVLTWSVWFKAEAAPGVIFYDDDSQNGGDRGITVGLAVCGGASQPLCLVAGDFCSFIQSTNAVVTPYQWQQAVFTSDISGQYLYLNGALVGSTNVIIRDHAGMSSVSVGAGNCTCGGPNFAFWDRFKGAISKVRIYNRALSRAEVEQLYLYESMTHCIPYTAVANAVVVNGFVVGATVTDGGCGYTNTPSVRVIGGGGSGARAMAVVTNGMVVAIDLLNAGFGYTGTPIVVIEPPFIPQPTMGIAALFYGPLVPAVLQLNLGNLSPYDHYQLEFAPVAGGTWTNLGAPFTPSATTNTQYANAIGNTGFLRVKYVP